MKKLNIGIIHDGNRKWAKGNGWSWEEAYIKGAYVAAELVRFMLTRNEVARFVFFALAQENRILRPPDQVTAILKGIERFLDLTKTLPIKLGCHGDPSPSEVARLWPRGIHYQYQSDHTIQVNLLFNYSALWDLETRPIRTESIPSLDLISPQNSPRACCGDECGERGRGSGKREFPRGGKQRVRER